MPRLREDQQPDAVIDLRHGSLQRAQTDEILLVDEQLPEPPAAPVFTVEPVVLDSPGSSRKKRRVAELEEIVATNARAAFEARAIALEQHRILEAATDAWRSTAADLADLRRDLKGFAAARADLIAKERARAEQAARAEVAAELQQQAAARNELQAEIDRLRALVTEHQTSAADSTQRLRDEQRQRAEAEKEAKRAIAAYETAERRLETVGEALQRHATEEQDRIEAAESARAEAEAELAALGGGGQVAKLTSRVEDLVQQLGELDSELAATESRADRAETAAATAAADLESARAEFAQAQSEGRRIREQLDDVTCERDELRAEADAGASEVSALQTALDAAVGEAADAKNRATVARVRLDEIAHERDELLATIAGLEQAAEARERRAADDLARAAAALELADTTDLEAALVAARFDAEALRGETTALAAQLEDAWSQVEQARRMAQAGTPNDGTHDTGTSGDTGSTGNTDADVDGTIDAVSSESLLDAFADLVVTPEMEFAGTEADDEAAARPVEREVRMAPPPPDPEDPDARRAALGFLNSLARDDSGARRHGH